MGHSNQVREFVISDDGVDLVPVAVGPRGVLTGSARLDLEAEHKARKQARDHDFGRQEQALMRRKRALDAQIEGLRAELAAAEEDLKAGVAQSREVERRMAEAQNRSATSRGAQRGGGS